MAFIHGLTCVKITAMKPQGQIDQIVDELDLALRYAYENYALADESRPFDKDQFAGEASDAVELAKKRLKQVLISGEA